MEAQCIGKSSWPELMGWDGDHAVVRIEKENRNVNARILPPRTFVRAPFSCTNVWVRVDDFGKVNQIPQIG
ncbi:hypothetical protein ACHQM5_014418 [Ranunculus cassubicifolius]